MKKTLHIMIATVLIALCAVCLYGCYDSDYEVSEDRVGIPVHEQLASVRESESETIEVETAVTEIETTEAETTEAEMTEAEMTEAETTEAETTVTETTAETTAVILPVTEAVTKEAVVTETPKAQTEIAYVLNTNTKKFHEPDCSSVKDIKDKNREDFYGTREEAVSRGFDPCGRCKP